jgi:enamine deaminase RidA (YjgF/YER057c/UK114 family)
MALGRVEQALSMGNADLRSVAQLTVFVSDIREFLTLEPMLARAFGESRPALTVIEVPAPGVVAGARISLTAIAWLGDPTT